MWAQAVVRKQISPLAQWSLNCIPECQPHLPVTSWTRRRTDVFFARNGNAEKPERHKENFSGFEGKHFGCLFVLGLLALLPWLCTGCPLHGPWCQQAAEAEQASGSAARTDSQTRASRCKCGSSAGTRLCYSPVLHTGSPIRICRSVAIPMQLPWGCAIFSHPPCPPGQRHQAAGRSQCFSWCWEHTPHSVTLLTEMVALQNQ